MSSECFIRDEIITLPSATPYHNRVSEANLYIHSIGIEGSPNVEDEMVKKQK